MNKISILLILLLTSSYCFSQDFVIKKATKTEHIIEVYPQVKAIDTVLTSKGNALRYHFENGSRLLNQGAPEIQKLTTSMIIPDEARMKIEVINSSYQEYTNVLLAPNKGNLTRDIDIDKVPYSFSAMYNKNAFYPSQMAELRDPYILRDFRGQTIVTYPIQYNPVTKVVRVYDKITLKLSVKDQSGINKLVQTNGNKANREFTEMYRAHFLNHNQHISSANKAARYVPVEEEGDMLIIAHGPFMPTMEPFIEWKKQRGIDVKMVDVSSIGGISDIKDYIEDYYNNNNLVYVLFVGDDQHIPTITLGSGWSTSYSDNSYGYILGNDHYPEVFIGRFSAETVAEVQTQVDRVLRYEKNPDPTKGHFTVGLGIASNQGPGDNNEMDYEHIRNIRTDLLNYTYSSVHELYDGSQGGLDAPGDPTSSDAFNIIQSGVSVINYAGHGSSQTCSTTGLSSGDVDNLTNVDMYPFFWSVACVNGDFVGQTCFAEEWARATHNSTGEPTGAIAVLMSTINQSWDPPMSGQDEMNDIMVESFSYNIKRSFGGISMNGCMHMNDAYGVDGEDMTDAWTCFGDPSVMVRTDVPNTMNVSHAPTISIGSNQLQVNCNIDDALVCLTLNGDIIGKEIVSNGSATVNFNAINNLDTITVTVTAYNTIPYIGNVAVIPNSGAFVYLNSFDIDDASANNNAQAEYGETFKLNLELHNAGGVGATGVYAKLFSTDNHVTIVNDSTFVGSISANGQITHSDAFLIEINEQIVDQYKIPFTMQIFDLMGNNWVSKLDIVVNAPILSIAGMIIDDASGNDNGVLEPGETVDIYISNFNEGNASYQLATGKLNTANNDIVINTAQHSFGSISFNGQPYDAVFNVTLDANAPFGMWTAFNYQLDANYYSQQKNFNLKLGYYKEDFETDDLTSFEWWSSNKEWFTTTWSAYEGKYCLQSGGITDDEETFIEITLDVLYNDSITFMKKVSSEDSYDFLSFYIDGSLQDQWSGVVDWSREAYAIQPGEHTFKWSYEKDNLMSTNADAAWLDEIILPTFKQKGIDSNTLILNTQKDVISVYPNPVSDIIYINNIGSDGGIIQVFDIYGKLIHQQQLVRDQRGKPIATVGWAPGVYSLVYFSNNRNHHFKITKM